MTAFRAFHDELIARFGEEAAQARHELFFHAATPRGWRPKWRQGLRALAAAARDLWWLYGAVGPRRGVRAGELVRVASLPGPSGWRTLARASAATASIVLLHPRMGRRLADGETVIWLLRPSLSALVTRPETRAGRRATRGEEKIPISALAVAATAWRRALWRSAWRRSLPASPGALLLHNDFDMMNASAIGLGWPTICLQHGVPTDEFFPARADWQVVWGALSEQAYRAAGVPAERLIVDALGRGADAADPRDQPPSGLALLSQTHAMILGRETRSAFVRFADAAAQISGLRVLLHPQEATRRTPYRAQAGIRIERPPHRLLTAGAEPPAVVLGLCSTALLDALIAGHFVVGLSYPSSGIGVENAAARRVASPPEIVVDAAAAGALLERLRSDPRARSDLIARLRNWRRASFAPSTGGLSGLLARVMPS
ncbi:MAG: hypothetical protein ACOVVK_20510 [Elsteraceae bacterium]